LRTWLASRTNIRTGHYHEAVAGNVAAVKSDSAYLHHGLVPYGPGHNSVFLVCSALWGGERAVAYKYAGVMQQIFASAPARRDGPDGTQAWAYPMLVALRFGDWSRVRQLDVAPPGNFSMQWPYGYGVLRHFSLAVAGMHLGENNSANEHMLALQSVIPAVIATGSATLRNLTSIANHTASGISLWHQGELNASIEALGKAVTVEMGMPYDEPPAWILPSRECYGQALLDAGRPQEAEQTFRAALGGYSFHAEPHCGWALHGLRASLQQQQESGPTSARAREVEDLTEQIARDWKHADVPLTSACLHLGGRSESSSTGEPLQLV